MQKPARVSKSLNFNRMKALPNGQASAIYSNLFSPLGTNRRDFFAIWTMNFFIVIILEFSGR